MKKFIVSCAIVAVAFLFPVTIQAQTGGDTAETIIDELPVEPDTGTSDNEATTSSADSDTQGKTPEQISDFVKGLAAGAVFGLVVGGVVVWFTKKS